MTYLGKIKCTKCGVLHNASHFYKDKSRKNGLTAHCKDCRQIYRNENPADKKLTKFYYLNNIEKFRNYYKLKKQKSEL